jgi:hypothetical protein
VLFLHGRSRNRGKTEGFKGDRPISPINHGIGIKQPRKAKYNVMLDRRNKNEEFRTEGVNRDRWDSEEPTDTEAGWKTGKKNFQRGKKNR